ncbi:transmembrane protein 14C-like [Acropora palmata]|uniref:transmembrane protein 14C-like n=1 Tax=Acropora palmata TaxID=6131 RepID=UPI003DA04030
MAGESKMALSPDFLSYGYSMIVMLGGVIGYAKAGSVPSLAAGLVFGGISAAAAYQTNAYPKNVWVMLTTSLLLSGVMGTRFMRTGKFMPAGLVAGLSIAQAVRMSYQLMKK